MVGEPNIGARLNPLPIAATYSKDPAFWGVDFEPQYLLHGDGAQVLGSDGKMYLDWVSALGANLLGYNHSEFVLRVQRQIGLGAGFSLPHSLEAQVAEKLAWLLGEHVPGWTPEGINVRFGLTGTDATTMAVRLARAVTGHHRILSFGYHGWGTWSIAKTPPHWGINGGEEWHIVDIPFNVLDTLHSWLQSPNFPIAAIILEQPMQDPEPDYYAELRRLCNQYGVLLILDEVVTGFRFALGGAAEVYGVEPDIACYGKALGNGIPISCIVGHKEYFDWFRRNDPVFVSSTHFGNAVSLAAADAVLDIWNQDCVNHIYGVGAALMSSLTVMGGFKMIGHAPRSLLQFNSPYERAYFILGMRDRGILMNRPNIPNLAHNQGRKDVAETAIAAAAVKREMDALGPDGLEAQMKDRLPRVLFEGR